METGTSSLTRASGGITQQGTSEASGERHICPPVWVTAKSLGKGKLSRDMGQCVHVYAAARNSRFCTDICFMTWHDFSFVDVILLRWFLFCIYSFLPHNYALLVTPGVTSHRTVPSDQFGSAENTMISKLPGLFHISAAFLSIVRNHSCFFYQQVKKSS